VAQGIADEKDPPEDRLMDVLNDIMRRLLWLPEQASTVALRIDYLHYFVIIVTMLSSLVVGGLSVFFFFKYRQIKAMASTPVVEPSVKFEVAVVSVPLVIFLLWTFIGFRDFVFMSTPPKGAMDIYVTGKKWMWHFAHPDGPNGNAVLHVPVGRPVRLLMTSRDVLHSFFVPEFRIKQDVIPGRYTETWFEATKPGRYRIFCTEFCGTWHSQMTGEVVVMPSDEYDRWLERQREGLQSRTDVSSTEGSSTEFKNDLVSYGKRVALTQGCLKCHSVDGTPHIGPTWVDMFMRKTELADGKTIAADEAYMTESMMDPYRKMVKGFPQVMPSFRGRLSAPDSAALVEFIKSLRGDKLQDQRQDQKLDQEPRMQEGVYEPAKRN
jgi:cytochrome c oxidase subunit 2